MFEKEFGFLSVEEFRAVQQGIKLVRSRLLQALCSYGRYQLVNHTHCKQRNFYILSLLLYPERPDLKGAKEKKPDGIQFKICTGKVARKEHYNSTANELQQGLTEQKTKLREANACQVSFDVCNSQGMSFRPLQKERPTEMATPLRQPVPRPTQPSLVVRAIKVVFARKTTSIPQHQANIPCPLGA